MLTLSIRYRWESSIRSILFLCCWRTSERPISLIQKLMNLAVSYWEACEDGTSKRRPAQSDNQMASESICQAMETSLLGSRPCRMLLPSHWSRSILPFYCQALVAKLIAINATYSFRDVTLFDRTTCLSELKQYTFATIHVRPCFGAIEER